MSTDDEDSQLIVTDKTCGLVREVDNKKTTFVFGDSDKKRIPGMTWSLEKKF